jgi:hypothetical protein
MKWTSKLRKLEPLRILTHLIWAYPLNALNVDSASMNHAPQIGLCVSPFLWRWLNGHRQCPVSNEVCILSLFFDKFSKYLVNFHCGCAIHSLHLWGLRPNIYIPHWKNETVESTHWRRKIDVFWQALSFDAKHCRFYRFRHRFYAFVLFCP